MPAPALRDIQASFWRSLRSGAADALLAGVVLPTPMLEPRERIEIYQEMYFWRLQEVLREDFPKTHEALGCDLFEGLARRYIARHPSEHPSVRHVGARLAAFLESDELASERPWLPDLVRLERARTDAFDAPDAVPVVATDLCALEPEAWADLRLETISAVEVIRSEWPIHEIWADPAKIEVAPGTTVVRIWRQGFVVFHAAIDAMEDSAFSVLRAGEPFAAICEAIAEHVPAEAAAIEAGSLLARWIENGLIARLAS